MWPIMFATGIDYLKAMPFFEINPVRKLVSRGQLCRSNWRNHHK